MTVNQFFRVLTFLLGIFIFPTLLAIGVWSAQQYGTVLEIRSTSLAGLGGYGQLPELAIYQEARSDGVGITRTLAPLYCFSLMMTFTLLRHKPNYLALVGVTTMLVVSLALTNSSVDWVVVAALTPAFLFLSAWGVAVGPAWEEA